MKPLIFDQNLSPRLVSRLADLYQNSSHVEMVGLGSSFDTDVWTYARQHGYTIVTKDADFGELLLLHGFPPKVVWIRRGNCATADIEVLLRNRFEAIEMLDDDPNTGILALY
jgi:predicted nuclease of predicted toxin-antitoxin system